MFDFEDLFEAWWADTGEQSLYALNTTTDDDIKILAGIAWEAAIREALAESKQAPDGRIPKTVFTIEDIGKAAEMGRQAGMIDALAEPVKQEPVAFMFKVKRTTKAITVLDEFAAVDYFPQDDEEIVSKEPLSYAAPVSAKRELVELTVSDLDAIIEKHYDDEMDLKAMILDGIAAFKEKNT